MSTLARSLFNELYFNAATLLKKHRLPAAHWKANYGYCPICESRTLFAAKTEWLRDYYFCLRCYSIPRHRAIIRVLELEFPNWRSLRIHESSPGGPSADKLKRECVDYTETHYFTYTTLGKVKDFVRCENLEQQTFKDEEFDLIITQDVFEHILNPDKAFQEIARTLKPGGAHVFTVPWYSWKPTLVRAKEVDGVIQHLEPPEYHGNPIDPNGSLVVTEWGADFCDYVFTCSGMHTTPITLHDLYRGIDAEFIDVFVSRKA